MTSRIVKAGDALSQFVNVAFLPKHHETDANESISGRAYRQDWAIRKLINILFFWQEDHCKEAYFADVDRARALVQASENFSQTGPYTTNIVDLISHE